MPDLTSHDELYAHTVLYHLDPIVDLLDDPEVTEVLINGWDEIHVERAGRLERVEGRRFEDPEALLAACVNIAQYSGKRIDRDNPRIDGRLPDGSRVHIVVPPISTDVRVAIRKFARRRLGIGDLVAQGSLSAPAARMLRLAIELKKNLLVSGGTGSGKTTLLNVLSTFIAPDERILVLEDTRELQIPRPHVVSLEARAPDDRGRGEVTIRDLLHSVLRLRPDRILVGEVRGGEALDLLNALNSGHGGTMSTLHANSPLGALAKLETLVLFAGEDLPARAIRAQICTAVQLVVQATRFRDGSRRVDQVAELLPQLDERGGYRIRTIFRTVVEGRGPEGRLLAHLRPTGVRPTFLEEARARGLEVDPRDYDPAAFDPAEPWPEEGPEEDPEGFPEEPTAFDPPPELEEDEPPTDEAAG